MPSVCVIVVSDNEQARLRDSLTALAAQSRPADEIIVVDNASADGSPDMVRSEFPDCRLMALNQSGGTAAAVNLALDETSAELVGIVLPCFTADSEWLASLVAADDPSWDCWASLVRSEDGSVASAGLAMTVVGSPVHVGRGEETAGHSELTEVFGCCYPALFYRRSMLVDVLGFDSDFFTELDDVDVAFRGRLRGHRCAFVPAATGICLRRAGRPAAEQVFFRERNSVFVFWQNMPAWRLALFLPERVLQQSAVALRRIVALRGWSWARGKLNAARNFGKVLKKRSRVQAGRSVDNRQLGAQLSRNWLRRA